MPVLMVGGPICLPDSDEHVLAANLDGLSAAGATIKLLRNRVLELDSVVVEVGADQTLAPGRQLRMRHY